MRSCKLPLVTLTLLGLATAAFATAAHLGVFNQTYKPKSGTSLAKAGCSICHTGGFSKLNSYGIALKGKPVNAKTLKSIEKLDSDRDKASNIDEIKAGTLPGDPKSKPAKATKAAKIADYDPVCKMRVNKNAEPRGGKSTYKGVTYYFCNPSCKAAFDKNPGRYVK